MDVLSKWTPLSDSNVCVINGSVKRQLGKYPQGLGKYRLGIRVGICVSNKVIKLLIVECLEENGMRIAEY